MPPSNVESAKVPFSKIKWPDFDKFTFEINRIWNWNLCFLCLTQHSHRQPSIQSIQLHCSDENRKSSLFVIFDWKYNRVTAIYGNCQRIQKTLAFHSSRLLFVFRIERFYRSNGLAAIEWRISRLWLWRYWKTWNTTFSFWLMNFHVRC